ncbi:MAG TPA: proline dehydrogenase family protein [Symbiobacteriaceae bacterium]|jgi:proline dehydrogenase|nr:proline dehydrogenase family protein [Symbiobacteriaceae bacterium]
MDLNSLYRNFVLTIAANKAVTAMALKVGMKLGASRFVAGETLDQALEVVKDLNRRGILVTLDQLGEGVFDEKVAREMCQGYLDMLDGIARTGVKSNVSLKPTQMGLSFDRKLTEEILLTIVHRAKERGNNFVRIDMEDTPYTDATLEIYRMLRAKGYDNVGTVIQSYLYRTEKDIADLMALNPRLRIVKGAYKEPPEHAFPKKFDVDENYKKVVATLLQNGHYTAVATHDEKIVQWLKEFAREQNIPRDQFEIQMLYGVRMSWQEELAREGYQVRCYVPFGRMWYPYFTRRIAERPGNFWFVVKNMIKG